MHNFKEIEEKWQKAWEEDKIFRVREGKKRKFYCLEMFPYPSASGLHMGHALNYTIGDVYARFKRMNGFNVLYPMGYDSLGLPAENAAIKAGLHPKKFTEDAINQFIKQQKSLGLSYDWNRIIMTHTPKYYKWNQLFFLKFYENGLVYRKKAPVNFCRECSTVLANEQVHNGKCWRHTDNDVEIRHLEQWFIKTTKYAEELLNEIERLEWPERIKIMQRNWIGKSQGIDINFKIDGKDWKVFTTRPDTLFGVTFMVVSAQHQNLMDLAKDNHKKDVEEFLKKIKSTSERDMDILEKEGVFTGSYAINPVTNEEIPVYAGNFVVAEYGSGMVMAVPAHDQRDFEFAKKYNVSIKVVIEPGDYPLNPEKMSRAYIAEGNLVNSGDFDGMNNVEAIEEISKYLEKEGLGCRSVNYKLKDWLVSRQRYWGTPIPVIYCDKCGVVPVNEDELPVVLPNKIKFGVGNPLTTNKSFINVKCNKCGNDARRETDTMDTFFDSSWYFLRYCDSKNNKMPFSNEKVGYWMPVDQYIGGAEHACMHLIYARFFIKALRDLGYLHFDEPFKRLFNQGMLHGEDGCVMSKSRGNVVMPETVSEKYGIDTARLFLVSGAAPDKDMQWSESGVEGSSKFINKVISCFDNVKIGGSDNKTESRVNKAIKEISEDLENFRHNLAVIKLRKLFDYFGAEESKEALENFLKLLSPFCPHVAEELWHKLGNDNFISVAKWPKYNKKKIDERLDVLEGMVNNTVDDINAILKLIKTTPSKIILVVSCKWKYSLLKKLKSEIERTRDVKDLISKLMDNKHKDEIPKIIQNVLKNPKIVDCLILDQDAEYKALYEVKDMLSKEFGLMVEIEMGEASRHEKARNAMPGKPAIIMN